MVKRLPLLFVFLVLSAGCRQYDSYGPLADQRGLIPAPQWEAYGQEQAVAAAIGREFASAFESRAPEALGRQMAQAVAFAESQGVDIVRADTLGHRLTVRFPSGWRLAVLPIPE